MTADGASLICTLGVQGEKRREDFGAGSVGATEAELPRRSRIKEKCVVGGDVASVAGIGDGPVHGGVQVAESGDVGVILVGVTEAATSLGNRFREGDRVIHT